MTARHAMCKQRVPSTYAAPRSQIVVRIAAAATLTALMLLAPRGVSGQDWRTASYSRQTSGEEMLRVNIEYGAGIFNVSPAAEGTLYHANLRYDADALTPTTTFRDGRLRFSMNGGNVRGRNLRDGLLDLKLGTDVPLDLVLAFGASDANLELGGMRVRRAGIKTGASRTVLNISSPNTETCDLLSVSVGAAKFEARGLGNLNARRLELEGGVGEIILDFSGSWSQNLDASIEMGLGSLTLRVPSDLGLRITRTGVLASFDSEGLTKRGNVYYSQNWGSTSHSMSLDLEAALGTIKVVWIDPQP